MLTEITALVEFLAIILLVVFIVLSLDKTMDRRELTPQKSQDDLPPNSPTPG
jgi:hypothetical protein